MLRRDDLRDVFFDRLNHARQRRNAKLEGRFWLQRLDDEKQVFKVTT
jgi:hypothetical protein